MKSKQSSQFDLKVHVRDAKGKIKQSNPYRLQIKDGIKTFERPPGSGYFYAENGDLIKSPKVTNAFNPPKVEFNADALTAELEQLKAQNEALKAKLEAKVEVTETDEQEEVNLTVDDIKVDDIKVDKVDISEEIQLMKEAGVDAAKIEQIKKPTYSKPNYLKK